MYYFSTFLLFLLAVASCRAQHFEADKIDELMDLLAQTDRYMGSVHVSHEGKTLYSRAVGFSDRQAQVAASTDTRYRIGSISKTFTAALVMKAVEAKQLSLNQSLKKWFPKVKNAKDIQIKHLLNHRSGIHSFTDEEDYLDWNTQAQSSKELLTRIQGYDSDFEPNSKSSYSNSNYVLLTLLLEKVTGKPYTELVAELANSMNLENTYVGKNTDLDKGETYSYTYQTDWEKSSITDMSVPLGAGAIVSTPSDLSSFIRQLFTGTYLSKSSLEQMTTIEDQFGYGLFTMPYNNHRSFGHTGGIDGFTSMLGYFPEDDLTIALCSNGARYTNNDIALLLLASFYGDELELPVFKEPTLTVEELKQYVGVYSSDMVPLKITITQTGQQLMAQATNQMAFPLDEKAAHSFEFKAAGVVINFDPKQNSLTLLQGGQELLFKR